MPTLKEVLADKTNYQDALVWNMGNGVAVTLGQLRALSAEDQSAISKRETEAAAARAKLDADLAELKKAQANTGNLFITLQKVQEDIKAGRLDTPEIKQLFGNSAPPNVGGNGGANDPFAVLSRLEGDSIMGPLVGVIKLVNAEAKKAQEAVAANIEVQKKMATNYMNGVLEDRYDRVVPADKQDKITLEFLIKDAVAHNEWASDSTPNIRAAYKRATAADTLAADRATAVAEDRKKVAASLGITVEQLEARIAGQGAGAGAGGTGGSSDIFIPTPQTFGLDVHNRSGKAPQAFKTLDEAFAAAAKDPEIWSQVDSLTH